MKNNLPQGWVECQLGQVFETSSGGTPKRGNPKYYQNGTIPWLKSGELNNSIIYNAEEFITEEALNNSSAKIFPKGSLLIALYGATVGKLGILDFASATNQAVCCIYQNVNYNKNFLFYYLLLKKEYLVNQGKGGAQPNISQEIIKALLIPFPPLNEQRRIVEKMESQFAKIDKGLEYLLITKDKIKQYRQSVLKSAFEGKLTQQNPGDEPAEILLQKINPKANCIHNDKLPQGWVECQLGQVFEIVTGKTPSKKHPEYFNGNIPFVKPGDLDKKIYITKTEDDSLTLEGFKNAPNLPKNTVLVSCIGNLGKKAILGIAGSCNQQINAIIPNDFIENKYVYYYIDKIIPWLEKNSSATTVKILNKGKFEQAPFLLPPQNEQRRIVEEIETRFALADKVEKVVDDNIKQAKQLKQSILKKAFEGRLVPQDPTDEPASVLLEKIKKEKNNDRK